MVLLEFQFATRGLHPEDDPPAAFELSLMEDHVIAVGLEIVLVDPQGNLIQKGD
jgi:hypothetical protein